MNKYSNNKGRMSSASAGLVLLVMLTLGLVMIPQRSASAAASLPSDQTNYRWRNDNGSETTATWATAVNTPIGGINDNDKLRLRLAFLALSGPFTNFQAKLQFSSDASSCQIGSGTWADVTAATVWKTFDSANYAEPVAATQQISSPGNFIGGYMNDTTNLMTAMTFNSGDGAEYEWAIQANGISAGARYFFRVAFGGFYPQKFSGCAMIMTTEPATTVSISNAVVSGMSVGP